MWRIPKEMEMQYTDCISRAVEQDKIFNLFKKINIFLSVTGHSDIGHVQHCWNTIQQHPEILALMDEYKLNDTIGSPNITTLGYAQDTIRFVQTACLIKDFP